jgi:hypothetical protein
MVPALPTFFFGDGAGMEVLAILLVSKVSVI